MMGTDDQEAILRLLRRTIPLIAVYYCFHAVPLEIKASQRYREVARCPVTEAAVHSANVLVTRFTWSSKADRFCPDMEYSYAVAGQSYTSRNQSLRFQLLA
jgi:hypothetical protein